MICAECRKAGEKSQVFIGGRYSTLMNGSQYWDEDGILHDHDPNTYTTTYACSKGHRWQTNEVKPCPGCGRMKNRKPVERTEPTP